jgi:hypothetical protein
MLPRLENIPMWLEKHNETPQAQERWYGISPIP